MPRLVRGRWLPLLTAGLLSLLSGCFGMSQNPVHFPRLWPTGDIIRTHAKPKGCGYYTDFDKHACRIEVRPLESTNPVQTQHVLLATIYDEKGNPRRNRRVEWMLEGVGNIVEVDESGCFPGRGYKVDNHYAVSYTDYCEHRITRGNANPNDDFVIRPGQTWCVISSAIEGDTHVSVYAPEIYDWDHHKVFVTKHWVDAEWVLPPPAVNRAGTTHTFSTRIYKHTTREPLENYQVRYRILDGPPALLLGNRGFRGQQFVAISDVDGNASVTLAQVGPQSGINRIGIEILRPPDRFSASGSAIIIGKGETSKEWTAASVAITKTGPPTAAANTDIPYTITVHNDGKVESQPMTVHDPIPEGLQFMSSSPPATRDGNQLVWTLGALPPGGAHSLQAVFMAPRTGTITNTANVVTLDGARAESSATTQIAAPMLSVAKTGPTTAVFGTTVPFEITVTNPGGVPATNVTLVDSPDPGFEHSTQAASLKQTVGTLAPGESKKITLDLTARKEGRLVNRVEAQADGVPVVRAEHAVTVQRAQLAVKMIGPSLRYVGRPAEWNIRVSNPGDVPLGNVVVRDQLPPDLQFTSATQGGAVQQNGEVLWTLGTLQPREEKVVQVTTRCLRITPRALNVAIATADPGIQVQDEGAIEIRGLPAYNMDVTKIGDPAEVGGRITYRIDVTNQGTLPGNQVQVTAIVPPQMRIVSTNGPTQARVEGQRVTFPPIDSVAPGQPLTYTIEVQALQPGDLRFQAELRSATLGEPVIAQTSTTIVAPFRDSTGPPPLAPGGPAPPAAPAAPGAPMGTTPGIR